MSAYDPKWTWNSSAAERDLRHNSRPNLWFARAQRTAQFSIQKCDTLSIPDVVLGAGEAVRRREFIALVGGAAVYGPSLDDADGGGFCALRRSLTCRTGGCIPPT
jgi:hypothetical protein